MYEEWRIIFKDDPRYEVSNFGRFRKKLKKGYRYLKPYKKRNKYVIKIKNKEYTCSRLVANTFIKSLGLGDCVYHKNGLEFDNFYRNLKIMSRKELNSKVGYLSKAKSVVLITNGEIEKWYRSARVAGRKLHINRQSVCDYCNNKVKNKIFNLMWEDDYFMELEKKGR